MTDRIRAVDCPSCGAPLELPPEHKRLFQCQFCGTTLEDLSTPKEQETGQQPKVIIYPNAPQRTYKTTKAETATTNSSNPGCWIAAISVGIVVIGLVSSFLISGDLRIGNFSLADEISAARIYSFGLTRLLPSDNDTQPDIVGVTYNSDETYRMVYVDFDADSYLRWQSEPLGDGANYTYNHVITSPSAIFMAYETTLVALDRADGTIIWQQEIGDEVSNICEGCLQVFDGWVVALTADGILTGFKAQTGETAWSERLNETTRQLVNLSGKVGVLDEEEDQVGINLYAPDTGIRLQRIVPQCPNQTFPDSPQTLGIYDPILLSNDGEHLYIPISSYDPGCFQKWETASMAMNWEASIPRDILDNFTWEPYNLTERHLFLSDGHNLFGISLQDGSYQTIYSDEDYNLVALNEQNGIVFTQAERTRGTSQYSLWGLRLASQTKQWDFDPTAEDIFDETSSVIYEEGAWSANTSTEPLIVLEAFAEPGVLTYSVLNLTDGNTTSQTSLEISDDESSYWMQVIGWQDEQVYLALDGRLWWIDGLTGTELASWP
jgi:hypothetical protein